MGAPLLGDAGAAEGARGQPRSIRSTALVSSVAVGLLLLVSTAWLSLPGAPAGEAISAPATALAALGAGSGRLRVAEAPGRATADALFGRAPGPLKEIRQLALAKVEASSRACGARDVSMKAEATPEAAAEEKKVTLKAQDMVGAIAPLGFWDPLGFSTNAPAGKLLFYREVELKHGRVCMLASLGFLWAEKFHPFFGGKVDVPSYIAFQATPLYNFWPLILIVIGAIEGGSVSGFASPTTGTGSYWMMKDDHTPGDLKWDPLGIGKRTRKEGEKAWVALQNKEINNGRLAMIATAGMVAQELVTGKKIFG